MEWAGTAGRPGRAPGGLEFSPQDAQQAGLQSADRFACEGRGPRSAQTSVRGKAHSTAQRPPPAFVPRSWPHPGSLWAENAPNARRGTGGERGPFRAGSRRRLGPAPASRPWCFRGSARSGP